MARKPLSEKSIAENVLKHGTGGINIDGCRVGTELISHGTSKADIRGGSLDGSISGSRPRLQVEEHITEGRFPANIMFDEEAGKILDEQSDKASRFFYCPKVSKKERNAGLEDMENRPSQLNSGGIGRKTSVEKRLETNGENAPTTKNHHPTVKPIALMEYLIKLVTPKGGTVLEPFMGSGSTGIAAKNLGMSFIGIEKEEEYFEIAKQRINGN
jgi:site-specific DNA-methyltransferase (adenine-specific)